MSHFRLHEQLPHWIEQLSIYTPRETVICGFAIVVGAIAINVGRVGVLVSPYVCQKCKNEFLRWLRWQVKQVFERAKWAAHTERSAKWAVLCALAVSTAVGLWIKLPLLRPLIAVLVPLSLLAFVILGWLDRGPRATRSFRSILKFFWAFFLPTWAYSLLAAAGAFAVALLEFL